MASPDPAILLDALKQMLKERQLSYSVIASAIGVSLPTIKRLLNKPTIPLDRLLEICDLAEIDLAELIACAETLRPAHTLFTPEQDDLFFRHPFVLSYFGELCFERRSPSAIAKKHKLNAQSTGLYLSQLEQVGLLERDARGRVKMLISPPLGFSADSKVLRAQHASFLQSVVKQVLEAGTASCETKKCYALLKPLVLPEKQYVQMVTELIRLVDRYAFLSEGAVSKTGNRRAADRKKWQLAIAAGPDEEPATTLPDAAIRNVTAKTFRKPS